MAEGWWRGKGAEQWTIESSSRSSIRPTRHNELPLVDSRGNELIDEVEQVHKESCCDSCSNSLPFTPYGLEQRKRLQQHARAGTEEPEEKRGAGNCTAAAVAASRKEARMPLAPQAADLRWLATRLGRQLRREQQRLKQAGAAAGAAGGACVAGAAGAAGAGGASSGASSSPSAISRLLTSSAIDFECALNWSLGMPGVEQVKNK